ncbi:MAG: hypothetical protein V4793_01455 [Paraburkholderia tropica]
MLLGDVENLFGTLHTDILSIANVVILGKVLFTGLNGVPRVCVAFPFPFRHFKFQVFDYVPRFGHRLVSWHGLKWNSNFGKNPRRNIVEVTLR